MLGEVEECGSQSRIAAKAVNAIPRIFLNLFKCLRVRKTQRGKEQSWCNGRVSFSLNSNMNQILELMLPHHYQKALLGNYLLLKK